MKRLLLFSVLVVASVLNVFAYDFSAVTPSRHRLCYNIVNGNAVLARQPAVLSGVLIIPDTVSYAGITYQVVGIGPAAFSLCNRLTAITIPNTVTAIGDSAFNCCLGLSSITIPNSVTSIGNCAFCACQGLISLIIPNSVTSIGHWAFKDCTGLTSIYISASVTSMGYAICEGCTGIASMTVDTGNIHYDSRNNCNAIIETATNKLISGCQNTVIPNTVTSIGYTAFGDQLGITSMPIPNSVTSIEYGAFWSSGLTAVIIPSSVTSIGPGAFCQCHGLTSVTIPNSVVSIGNSAFKSCNYLTTVNFNADSCVTMGSSYFPVFEECRLLSTLNIGANVSLIPAYAFYGCDSLRNPLFIPNSVTSIGNMAFFGCSSIPSTTIGSSVISIGDHAFQYCTCLSSVTIGDAVNSIGEGAFYGCSGMNSLAIGGVVERIGCYAFFGCSNLDSLSIPNSVTTIGDYAFAGCCGLSSVSIGGSVTNIGEGSFQNCTNLPSVTIPRLVTNIGGTAFLYCIGLTEITCLATVAPTLGLDVFIDVASTIPVYIPCESLESYRAGWSHFTNFVEIYSHSLTVRSADETMGTVAITIQPSACSDSIAEVAATANFGYRFDHWSDGSTSNPYTFSVTCDTTIIAYFVSDGGSDGVEEITDENLRIYTHDGRIVIVGAETENVQVFDMMGRLLHTDNHPLPTGIYMVKVGTLPARKVVVIR